MESKNLKRKELSELTVRFLSEVKRIGVSFYDISKKTGAQESMFTKIKGGIQEPSKKFLNVFFECYPNADKVFVLVGEQLKSNVCEEKKVTGATTVTERFFEVLEAIRLRPSDLLKESNGIASKQSLSNAKNGRNDIPLKLVAYLCESRDNISANYILTGRGSMFIETPSGDEEYQKALQDLYDEVKYLREENDKLREIVERTKTA